MADRHFNIPLLRRRRFTGGGGIPNGAIVQRDGAYVLDRAGNYVINVARGGVVIPNGAIVQRDGAYVLDRAGNYVINVTQS